MIVLDTNVLSEVMKELPDTRVVAWVNDQDIGNCWITSITVAELIAGVYLLPEGRRCQLLHQTILDWIERVLGRRVLAFDIRSAIAYGPIVEGRTRRGRPSRYADAQIAAINRVHNATLATRTVDDFDGTGVTLINPWEQLPTQQ